MPVGLSVELIGEAARRAGVRLEWVPTDGISPDEALRRGLVDLWPAVATTPARVAEFHLTEPWLKEPFALMSREESRIGQPADTRGKTVAFTGFPLATAQAKRLFPNSTLITAEYRMRVLDMVCTGEADAGFDEASYLSGLLLQNQSQVCLGVRLKIQW
jgi:hypothetical protein